MKRPDETLSPGNLNRLVKECPLVDDLGRLVGECLLVAELGTFL